MAELPETASASEGIGTPPMIDSVELAPRTGWIWAVVAVLLAIVLGLLFLFNPTQYSFYPTCVFYRVTGWECPGCGGLRAVHHLLHGDVAGAFRFNPLVVTAFPLLAVWAVMRRFRGPGKPLSHRAVAHRTWILLAVLILFWVVRNLPFVIFKMPAS